MPIMQEIFSWSKSLPPWQSDAVARIIKKQQITENDYDDLYALLKISSGIPDPQRRQPAPLTADQVPAPAERNTHVRLLTIKNLKNVNAIAPNQCLMVGESGMTVIYGDNGSGKSGYSRVLKRACRARDQSEPIHPNANLPEVQPDQAEATFEITINSLPREVVWRQGQEAPPELSAISIFDARCARAYLDNEDDFSYIPYGLDVFESLAKLCQQFKVDIEREINNSNINISAFGVLQGDTAVGKLIASLSEKTKIEEIERLSALTQQELEQKDSLEKNLKENNPKEKAIQIRNQVQRIESLTKRVIEKTHLVSEEIISEFETLADSYRIAQNAAKLAAKQFNEDENFLPGTGGEAWRELFDAARKFALEAHPDKQFPNLGEDALCPLCQQPLAEDGAQRLLHFEEFIQAEAEKTMQLRRQTLYAKYKPFIEQSMTLNCDEVMYKEITAIDPQLATGIRKFESALAERQEAIKKAISSHEWSELDSPLSSPSDQLLALTNKLTIEAQALENAADEEARVALQKQLGELNSRLSLNKMKDAVIDAVRKLNYQAKLKKCLSAVETTSISRKASELAKQVVSKELADALNREFGLLGAGTLKVSLQSRSSKGKALHELKLDLPQKKSPSDILSEGEQRAIAIGAFLAEVGLSGSTGGIVFDDPVSSLDHRRRERVAKRFAQEAEKRQVIIFTHDIYFLCVLVEEAKRFSIPISTQSLIRHTEGFGVAVPDLPFEGKKIKDRIAALKEQQETIAQLCNDRDEQEQHKQTVAAYVQLRMAWERSVEEVLLQNVILRFRKGVETQRLSGVSVEDGDYEKIFEGMSKCSIYAHDKAIMGGIAVPEPNELLEDISKLEEWLFQVKKRSEETTKRRRK